MESVWGRPAHSHQLERELACSFFPTHGFRGPFLWNLRLHAPGNVDPAWYPKMS